MYCSERDKNELIAGIVDGTIDMIATDHAPHSAEEKSRGLAKSTFGIVGLDTCFAMLYTYLVKPGVLTLEKLVDLMAIAPAKRFGLPLSEDDYTVFRLGKESVVDPESFLSMGKATPFTGWQIQGKCVATVCDGKIVYTSL